VNGLVLLWAFTHLLFTQPAFHVVYRQIAGYDWLGGPSYKLDSLPPILMPEAPVRKNLFDCKRYTIQRVICSYHNAADIQRAEICKDGFTNSTGGNCVVAVSILD